MSRLRPSLRASARLGFAEVLKRPHIVTALLVANLIAAWILTAPLYGLLSTELDHTLYGDAMATGASWRWFDTVDRNHPQAFGNLDAWGGLLSDGGVRWGDLRKLSGPALSFLLAGFSLFGLSALLHSGFLATLPAERRMGFAAATAYYALPTAALTFFAAVIYVAVYGLLYVQTGKWLEDFRTSLDSEWAAMALTWTRLGLTLAVLLLVKLVFDLSRVVLVDRGNWNWPWAFLVAVRELTRRPGRYLQLYLGLGAIAPILIGIWSLTFGRFAPQGWLGLLLLFLAQQIFLGARLALRLTHLSAARQVYLEGIRLREKPPFKVEAPDGEA